MPDIVDDQVDELLREAELRLQHGSASTATATSSEVAPLLETAKPNISNSQAKLSVRMPQTLLSSNSVKEPNTAGSNWFDLPKTKLTPEFKRDWQMLRMRGVLDPKHQKKALRASAPEYSHVGEIIAGPTEFFSARLTRKERKSTLLEEAMATHNRTKLQNKYADIQWNKTRGKKTFYRNLLAQRRKRQN